MHALISGASVAGPVLAYWLRRHGWQVTVVERAPSLRAGDGGHAVDLFGPAVEVIERMGLLERVHAARTRNDTINLVRGDDRPPITVTTADLVTGVADRHIEIMRGELAGILHDATRDDVDYRFGTVIDRLDGTTAVLSDGSNLTADLVAGADGLHSGVRALAFGPERDFRHFLGAYLAVFTLPDVLGMGATVAAFAAPDRTASVYPTLLPGRSRALFLMRTPAEIPYDRRDPAAQKAIVRNLVGDALGPRIAEVLSHLDAADDFYFDEISQIRMDSWSRGHVTLVGDAGYGPGPAVGGGTSLAVAGAYVLAAELGTDPAAEPGTDPAAGLGVEPAAGLGVEPAAGLGVEPVDVPAALARYQAALAGPVLHGHRIGPAVLNAIVPRNGAQVWAMAQAMRLIPRLPRPLRARLTSFGGGPAAMLDGIALPPADRRESTSESGGAPAAMLDGIALPLGDRRESTSEAQWTYAQERRGGR